MIFFFITRHNTGFLNGLRQLSNFSSRMGFLRQVFSGHVAHGQANFFCFIQTQKTVEHTVVEVKRNFKWKFLGLYGQDQIFQKVSGNFVCDYDESQSIGKRYRRQDEIGTPFCVTVDFDTLEDNAVTVRERDSMDQERVAVDQLNDYLSDKLV